MSVLLKEKYKNGEMIGWLKGKSKETHPELIKMYGKVSKTMSKKQQHNSRGYSGIRIDIGHFATSTYEANIYRIFQYEKKSYKFEHDNIFPIIMEDGTTHHYRIDIQDIDGLFGYKEAYIEIKGFMNEKSKNKIENFKNQYTDKKLLTIGNGDKREEWYWEPDINYNDLEKKYKPLIPLWEDKLQNIYNKPELYTKEYTIGKREQKRKHKRFLQTDDDYNLKIGCLWKKQPFNGRPKDINNNFMDNFKIYHNETELNSNENWGAILAIARQHIKDNVKDFYNNNEKIYICGHVKKTDEYIRIVEFDAMKNYWL